MKINNIPNNDNHEDHVDKVVTTSLYDKSYDKLVKDHKKDIVDDIDKTVDDLIYYRIDTQKSNHTLTNLKTNELHIRGNVLLLYKYGYSTLTISLLLLDLTDHKHLKNPEYQKQIKKTIKNLKENKGDKNMEYMEYTTTNENTLTVSFKFKNKITGADTMFDYEVPFEVFVGAIKNYFDKHFDVILKGKDKDIWNMLVDLGEKVDADVIQTFMDDEEIIEDLTDKLEEDAQEKFDEMCEEEADEELDEDYEDEDFDFSRM